MQSPGVPSAPCIMVGQHSEGTFVQAFPPLASFLAPPRWVLGVCTLLGVNFPRHCWGDPRRRMDEHVQPTAGANTGSTWVRRSKAIWTEGVQAVQAAGCTGLKGFLEKGSQGHVTQAGLLL